MPTLDEFRAAHPDLGFAVYAYTPGGPVTLEIHQPGGAILTVTRDSEAEAIAAAFPAPSIDLFE